MKDANNKEIKLGSKVTWTSNARGYYSEHTGKVVYLGEEGKTPSTKHYNPSNWGSNEAFKKYQARYTTISGNASFARGLIVMDEEGTLYTPWAKNLNKVGRKTLIAA